MLHLRRTWLILRTIRWNDPASRYWTIRVDQELNPVTCRWNDDSPLTDWSTIWRIGNDSEQSSSVEIPTILPFSVVFHWTSVKSQQSSVFGVHWSSTSIQQHDFLLHVFLFPKPSHFVRTPFLDGSSFTDKTRGEYNIYNFYFFLMLQKRVQSRTQRCGNW